MAEYGHLQEIQVQVRSTALTTAASVSDTDLVVDSAGDFDDQGGYLSLNGATLEYVGITWGVAEDDSDTIELADPLTSAADVDDLVLPVIGGQVAEDWWAVVDHGGGDVMVGPLNTLERAAWAEGVYDPPVPVSFSEDLTRLEDAPGRPASAGARVVGWTDTFTVEEDGVVPPLVLTYRPSFIIHVQWGQLFQELTEWSLDGVQTITVSDPDGWVEVGDVFTVTYLYDGASPQLTQQAVPLTFLGATADIDAWTFPAEAVDGGLLVAVAMVVDGKTPTLNGWTDLGQTDLVTHAASSGTYTYRLIALSTTYETGVTALPTIPSFGLDSVCLMAAFDATGTATVSFDTEDDDTTGYAPAISPSSIRVWGTIGNLVTPVAAGGTQIAYEPGSDICLLMTLNDSTAPAAANTVSASGWCMASIAVLA